MTGITGETALLAETKPLEEVAARHPFGEYARPIRCVELRRDEGGPCIVLDTADKVILRLSGWEGGKSEFSLYSSPRVRPRLRQNGSGVPTHS